MSDVRYEIVDKLNAVISRLEDELSEASERNHTLQTTIDQQTAKLLRQLRKATKAIEMLDDELLEANIIIQSLDNKPAYNPAINHPACQ